MVINLKTIELSASLYYYVI